MIVISMTDCPVSLRGDLTKWLMEISAGVFVGQVSARVRDQLWEHIKKSAKNGKVTMVFNTNNEQRLDFRVHNNTWEPIDFDGIKLMLRPSPSRVKQLGELRLGYSKASKRQIAKQVANKQSSKYPSTYVVVDVETSGLNPEEHKIIEIGAILVEDHCIVERFSLLVRLEDAISTQIEELTGISNDLLHREGLDIETVLNKFITFLRDLPMVSHNADFDNCFLRKACNDHNIPYISDRSIDTLTLARRKIRQIENFKLYTLANHFGIAITKTHRSIDDCELTYQIYEKLINLDNS